MNLRKHAAAKLTAVAAALFTMVGTFVLVHRNPPASDAAAQQPASTNTTTQNTSGTRQTSPSTSGGSANPGTSSSNAAPPVTRRTHTRTHAS